MLPPSECLCALGSDNQRVDGVHAGLVALDAAVVGGAEKFAGERADHAKVLFLRCCSAAVKWFGLPINSP